MALNAYLGSFYVHLLSFSLFALWFEDEISQAFKLYTASLKQGPFFPGNILHEQLLKFS